MRIGDPDGHGRYGILDHDDGRVLCHECGRWWQHLATHLAGRHGIAAADYRQAHGLPFTLPLVGRQVRDAMSAAWERNRPSHLAALDASRDPSAATEASRSRAKPWAPATVAARQRTGAARRIDLTTDQVERLGDPTDLPAWCLAARALIGSDGVSMAAIARASGLATATVSQRLRRYPAARD